MSNHGDVFLVDDDAQVRTGIGRVLSAAGFVVHPYESAAAFLAAARPARSACLILDQQMPELTGLELQRSLASQGAALPVIFLTGHGDVATSVAAMKSGAVDFLTKPVDAVPLCEAVMRALELSARQLATQQERRAFAAKVSQLTARELEVGQLVVRGLLNKQIAGQLGIAEKTVKIHRGKVMEKLAVGSVAELSRLVERTGLLGIPD